LLLRRFFAGITRLSLRFKWITLLLSVAFIALGVQSYGQLKQDLLPSIEFPQSFIVTLRFGASSEDLRDLITIPLEKELAAIPGIIAEGLESTTTAPVSFVTARNNYVPDQAALRAQIQAAIDTVMAMGVPLNLATTDDLTPEMMTRVLTLAPSMWAHFEAKHLSAMRPDVLAAALAVNPIFLEQVDFLTRDALAAGRVSAALSEATAAPVAVELPSAWRLGKPDANGQLAGVPRIINFNLGDLPIVTASISSETLSKDELRELVQNTLVRQLSKDNDADSEFIEGVANVSITGGEVIPSDVQQAADVLLEEARAAQPAAAATPAPIVTPTPATGGNNAPKAPDLAPVWRSIQTGFLPLINPLAANLLREKQITVKFDTAADLLAATDADGKVLPLATLLNEIQALNPNSAELASLSADALSYLRQEAPAYVEDLSAGALRQIAAAPLSGGAWAQLLQQEGIANAGVLTLHDLGKIGNLGSAAKTLNAIVANTPDIYNTFAIRLLDALTPESLRDLLSIEPDFLKNLDPQALRYFSAQTLNALPADFVAGLAPELGSELTAIAKGEQPSAAAALSSGEASTVVDDPNAPPMPASWVTALGQFGFKVETANDLFKPPFASPAAFFNQAAANPAAGNLMAEIPASLLLYLQGRDSNFYTGLTTATLKLFTPEVVAALPNDVQKRVKGGPSFEPQANVTRANGRTSLLISINKNAGANTVDVYHAVDKVFKATEAANPGLSITPTFEQASFIEESISGVAREGLLGAVMAVIVILIFLNFSVRSTIVTAVSIPTSLAIAFVMMRYLPPTVHEWLVQPGTRAALPELLHTFLLRLFPSEITLNIMTLSGVTVATGRVVDDSIVVLENIYRQVQKRSLSRFDAILIGTRDVSLAIFAATLTTIVVFLPIGLAGGVVGEFFLPFGLAVSYALLASFFVALTIIPVLAFWFISPDHMPEEKEGRLEHGYERVIKWALAHRTIVLVVAFASFAIGVSIFGRLPTTFLPSFGEPQISVSVTMPAGTNISETDALIREMEAFIAEKKAAGEVDRYQVNIGSGGGLASFLGGGGGSVNGANGTITIAVEARDEALNLLTAEFREKAAEIFGPENAQVSKASVSEQGFGGFAVVASGPEADLLAANQKVVAALSEVPGLANVSSSLDLVGTASSYLRVAQKAAVQYTAELEVSDTLGVTRKAIAAVKAIPDLPTTVNVGEGFQSQQQTEGFAQTFSAIGISVLAVYLVMVLTFGSLVHPFTILFTLPLAVVGAALGLLITNRVVGISALIGLLMLVGIVVTNAIVMIDRVQQNRKEKHMPTREALIEGARTRLRPILMTAIATMFALLPLAVGLSEGAIIAAELGTVVIGGLFSSTLLTLLVVPVMYSLFDAVFNRGKKA
jgi:multidrug efflux pump subunit AcrB